MGSWSWGDVSVVGFGVTFVLVVLYEAEATRVGETVDGGLKNEPSSKVSRKSL
jgi:hypothetical protein